MTVLKSFELKGNKQSFSSWISNLSPCESPFTSMIGKEKVDETQYSWQTDALAAPVLNAHEEGSDVEFPVRGVTSELTNFTQILRKVVHISDAVSKVSTYGRENEIKYQMEKAAKELKRDLEFTNLRNKDGTPGFGGQASKFAGFEGLVAPVNASDPDTGAVVHHSLDVLVPRLPWFTVNHIYDVTMNLFLSGSKADKIMFHPRHVNVFSNLLGDCKETPLVYRMFDDLDERFNLKVSKIRDPLGRWYTLIPNRYMPEDKVFFFSESDWSQTILREPTPTRLGKTGSSEKFMVEMEVGLRHKHPFSSGILTLIPSDVEVDFVELNDHLTLDVDAEVNVEIKATEKGVDMIGADVVWKSSDTDIFVIDNDSAITGINGRAGAKLVPVSVGEATLTVTVDGIPLSHVITVGRPTITLSADPSTVITGQTSIVSALVRKANGDLAEGVRVSWTATPSGDVVMGSGSSTTDEDGIAEVDVTGKYAGTVEIVATVGTTKSAVLRFVVTSATGVIAVVTLNKDEIKVGEISTASMRVYREATGENLKGVNIRLIVRPTWTSGAIPDQQTDASGSNMYAFKANEVNQYTVKVQIIGSIPLVESRDVILNVVE